MIKTASGLSLGDNFIVDLSDLIEDTICFTVSIYSTAFSSTLSRLSFGKLAIMIESFFPSARSLDLREILPIVCQTSSVINGING